ncbi:hypothetical protein ACFLRW_07235, partial [Acidobacteriota bacterium]
MTKKKKESKKEKHAWKDRRSLHRFLKISLIVFAVILIISLSNNIIYSGKLKRIGIKHDNYYQNLFPIQKDWLPVDWEARNSNAYNTYLRLFPPGTNIEKNQVNEHIKRIVENPQRKRLADAV